MEGILTIPPNLLSCYCHVNAFVVKPEMYSSSERHVNFMPNIVT